MIHPDQRARVELTDHGIELRTTLTSFAPGLWHFVIVQGATLSIPITWQDQTEGIIDVSAGSAALTVRQYYGSTALATLSTSSVAPLTGGITLASSAPNITIARTAAQTAAYAWTRALYDLELTTGGVTYKLLEGFVTLRKEVTT